MSEELLPEDQSEDAVPPEGESENLSESAPDNTEETPSEEPAEDGAGQEPPKKNGFERRIERFERKLEATAREAEYWRKVATEGAPRQPAQPAPAAEAPKFSDYNDLEAWAAARDEFVKKQLLEQLQQQTQVSQKASGYQSKEQAFRAATPDFEVTMAEFREDYAGVNAPDVVEFALESDVGPQLWYYLATHRDETDRLLKLSPIRRLGELGKIEDKLQKPAAAVKAVSTAPKPVKPTGAASSTARKKLDDPELSQEEYVRLRQAQKAGKR